MINESKPYGDITSNLNILFSDSLYTHVHTSVRELLLCELLKCLLEKSRGSDREMPYFEIPCAYLFVVIIIFSEAYA